ncbi:PEP-CTERM sorting domain-containing protein [Candidatus Binatus sp.]|uniref:PEP-CTERM sorting domain-containing protein n=1 Tax=Candidatus Binatus sp. TaxID=2811406 RepID=UPI003CC474A1
MKRLPRVLACILLLPFVTAIAASADSIDITFNGLKEFARVGNLYLKDGITFSDNARGAISVLDGGSGNFVPSPPPGISSLALLEGTAITMNVTGGFKSAFSFDYIAGISGSLTLYSGLAGTGSVLATILLPVTPTCSSGPTYCEWLPVGIDFSGTAKSAVFGGQHLYLVVDNIKLNTGTVSAVPEPASLLLVCTGIAGLFIRGRKLFAHR